MRLVVAVSLILYSICFYAGSKERTIIGCQPFFEDKVFISETEVSNWSYMEFLYHQSDSQKERFLPDTLVWKTKNEYNEPYIDYYLRHPAYRDYPVVGVSKGQAEAYCEWLGQMLTDGYRKNEKSDIDSVIVRLPTKKEWIYAAKGGNDYYEYPWKGHQLRIEEGKFQGNIRANFVRGKGDYMGIAGSLNDHADVTAPVKSYWPNDFGLYNCAGNVSEMVADEEVAMGGNWRSSGYNIKVTSEIPFTGPSSLIGFRYVVEVVKLKPNPIETVKFDKKWVKHHLVSLNDSMWCFKYEVTNKLYNQFTRETNYALQDTAVWRDKFPYSDWYTHNYRWHKDYENYPVVGINKSDVQAFSDWLNKKLESVLVDKVNTRLPTEEEWEYAARGGLDLSPYPWGGPYLRNSKGIPLANYKYIPDAYQSRNDENGEWNVVYPEGRHQMFGADLDGYMGPNPVDAYHPNGYVLHNLSGNVREMIKEDTFTKGGGWNSVDFNLQISSREQWNEEPAADVGFRLIVERK